MLSSISQGPSLLVALAILAIAVTLLIFAWRVFLIALVLALVTFVIWHLDVSAHLTNARRFGDQYFQMLPVNQVDLAHFSLGVLSGLIIFSTLFFVRTFAKAALVGCSIAITVILITGGVSGLMQHAATFLQFIKEFDFFIKGLIVGKFCVGLMKWNQIRHRKRSSAAAPV